MGVGVWDTMRRTTAILATVLFGAVLLAGAATAASTGQGNTPSAQVDSPTNESANDTAQVGICVTGVDSPCNGEAYDGDDEPKPVPVSENVSAETGIGVGDDAQVGICVIGVDSPCNAEQWEEITDAADTPTIQVLLKTVTSIL